MARERGKETAKKKRKKTSDATRKLLPGARVEVFCSDEGLNGSWHAGVVIGHEEGARVVEYANVSNQDYSSKLVEKISVSDAVEGRSWTAPRTYRGNIRPLPPPAEHSELKYGLCVDALVDEAWWEGVVFDHRDEGLAVRKIFFPDLGDQHVISVERLRLTQEWNEETGHWSLRGDWLLLQVLQELEQEDGLPVSTREIWYDLRSAVAFRKKIGVWTSGSRSNWRGLVLELIQELLSVVDGPFLAEPVPLDQLVSVPTIHNDIDNPAEGSHYPEGRALQRDDAGSLTGHADIFVTSNRSELLAPSDYILLGCAKDSTHRKEADGDCLHAVAEDRAIEVLGDWVKDPLSLPGAEEFNLECGSCCHVLSDFISEHHKRAAPWPPDARKRYYAMRDIAKSHLLAEGWEFKETNSGSKDYFSPDGKHCNSFIKACQAWKEVEENGNAQNKCRGQCIKLTSNCPYGKNIADVNLMSRNQRSWQALELEPEYCHELIPLYGNVLCDKKHQLKRAKRDFNFQILRSKLMRHLLALGWKIEWKKDTGRRLRFFSPKGKIYYSLCTACSALIQRHEGEDHRCKGDNASEGNHMECNPQEILSEKCYPEVQRRRPFSEMVDVDSPLDSGITEATSLCGAEEKRRTDGDYSACSNGKIASGREAPTCEDLEPENIPEAIQEYKEYVDSQRQEDNEDYPHPGIKQLRLNAKKHLIFMGWTLWMKTKKMKSELSYDSPHGKSYNSLYTACKAYLEEYPEGTTARSSGCMNKKKRTRGSSTNTVFGDSITEGMLCNLTIPIADDDLQQDVKVSEEGAKERLALFSSLSELEYPGGHKKAKKKKIGPSISLSPFDASHRRLLSSPSGHFLHQQSKKRNASQDPTSGRHAFSPRILRSSKRSRPVVVSSSGLHVARSVLSWLVDNDVILPRQKVSYIRKRDGRVMREGRITRDGIKCNCCQKVFSLTNFEAHAGSHSHRPAANIFLQDGRSLLQCQIQMIHTKKPKVLPHARMKSDYSSYDSDTVCSVCQDGGALVLCDHCPSSFHLGCVGLKELPEGKWSCPSCQCSICGLSEFNSNTEQFTEKTILYCDQCEREYHVGCLSKSGLSGLKSCPTGDWFCCKTCSKIYLHLHKLVGKSNPTSREGLSCTILRANGVVDVETMAEHHSKLRVALDILHECFVTIIEPRTQSDFVADLLFNRESELKRLKFWGFYTMLLERDDEVISVASFRVFGKKVAEMPLVGTRVQYRRQGMCRLLVDELEKLLRALRVERLLLPAVPQLLETWTTSFGFTEMATPERLELLEYGILNFQDTTLCQKIVTPNVVSSRQSSGHHNLLVGSSSQAIEKINQDNYNCTTEVLEMVEPLEVLPPPVPPTYCLLGEGDTVKEISYQASPVDSPPTSDCVDPGETLEPEANEQMSAIVEDDCISVEASHPTIPVIPAIDLDSSEKFDGGIGKDNFGSARMVKAINDGAPRSFKYFYRRRIFAK